MNNGMRKGKATSRARMLSLCVHINVCCFVEQERGREIESERDTFSSLVYCSLESLHCTYIAFLLHMQPMCVSISDYLSDLTNVTKSILSVMGFGRGPGFIL